MAKITKAIINKIGKAFEENQGTIKELAKTEGLTEEEGRHCVQEYDRLQQEEQAKNIDQGLALALDSIPRLRRDNKELRERLEFYENHITDVADKVKEFEKERDIFNSKLWKEHTKDVNKRLEEEQPDNT